MIPTTMLAASFQGGNDDLALNKHYPVPKPKKGEVLMKIIASGVCHSDVSLLSGESLDNRTYVMGHEFSGVPVELGEGVDPRNAKLGHLYAVNVGSPCLRGINGAPAFLNTLGIGIDGAYAEYIAVSQDLLIPVPRGVSPEEASMTTDAATTAYHAVYNSAGIREGSNVKVLIIGIGGLGHLAVQYAKHYGATVYAVDIKPEARALALELGAVQAFDLATLNEKVTTGNLVVDVTIDFVTTSQTFQFCLSALRPNAAQFGSAPKAVLVGVASQSLSFTSFDLVTSNIAIIPSLYGPRSATKAALDLFANKSVRGVYSTQPLDQANEVIDKLRAFEVKGRMILIPDHGPNNTWVPSTGNSGGQSITCFNLRRWWSRRKSLMSHPSPSRTRLQPGATSSSSS